MGFGLASGLVLRGGQLRASRGEWGSVRGGVAHGCGGLTGEVVLRGRRWEGSGWVRGARGGGDVGVGAGGRA